MSGTADWFARENAEKERIRKQNSDLKQWQKEACEFLESISFTNKDQLMTFIKLMVKAGRL